MGDDTLRYKRSKFSTRLPTDRLYSAGHFWLFQVEDSSWRVGMTKFALRMLGEPVEFEFEMMPGAAVEVGEIVGWIEGFKAVTDLYSPMAGRYAGFNSALDEEIGLVHSDPYDRGWLYTMEGRPGEDCVDAEGYAAMLDGTIDKMMGSSI